MGMKQRCAAWIAAGWHDTRGDFDDLLYAMLGMFIMAMLFLFIMTLVTVFAVRQHVYNSIVSAGQAALASNILDPTLAASGQSQDTESVYVSPAAVIATYKADFSQFLGWPTSAYTLGNETITVDEPSQKGQALPAGLDGTVPGTGIYVSFPYTVRLLPFLQSHTLEFGFAVQVFIPANRYFTPTTNANGNWIGG